MVPEIWWATDRWPDRRTDRQMEKMTYRGGCPTKKYWQVQLFTQSYAN